MAGLMVAGAFLTPVIQLIVDSLASKDFKDLLNKKLVKKLEIKFNSINKVLEDAETKQYQDQRVKSWLDELRHEVYEVEQLLDEIATSAQRKSKVKHFFSSFTNQFEPRIKDLLDKLEHLLKQNEVLGLKEGTRARNELEVGTTSSEGRATTSLVEESSICGREAKKEEIINFLLLDNGSSSNQAPIISIVGLGGMGKTTLAQIVYNDNSVQKNFELKAWVYVSNPFDIIRLSKEILEQFNSSSNSESLEMLQLQLQQTVTGKKYLLVLDDIWNAKGRNWEQLLIPFRKSSSGSKIIMTTRSKDDASAMGSAKLFELEQLGESDCWSLFVTHAFQDRNVSEYPDLESIGKMIVNKCGGLPLAVKTMGKLLRIKFSRSEWEKILKTDMWCLSERDIAINPVLRLSYHNLPSNLKRCFAYCSIFPKGYKFDKNSLIKLWMANGLLNSYKSDKSKEELGSELFDDLESISFFQRPLDFDGYFVMHDLVNDLAKSESGKFCLQVDGDKVQDIDERTRQIWCSLDLKDGDRILKHIYNTKGLQSLLVESPPEYSKWFIISNNVQCEMFSKLKYLRMLSFGDIYNRKLELADEIGNLKLLRYLNLSRTEIKRLPGSICKLYNLETLILEGCYLLTDFPFDFYKLDRLRHLNLKGAGIKKMPRKIGKLNHLQTLTHFVVGKRSGFDIVELHSLNLLQGKLCLSELKNVINPTHATKANLQDKDLEEIQMKFGWVRIMDNSIVESKVLEALQPNKNLKSLTIQNYQGNMLPTWLRGCDLPNLISLKLLHCNEIKIIDNNSTNVPFKFLEVLSFESMYNWEEWLCIEGLPRLKELSIMSCPKLKRVQLPPHLPSLHKLSIRDCKMLDVSIPNYDNIIELDILKCDRILINELSSSLKQFSLDHIQYVEFPMDHLINNPNLEVLMLDFKDFVECPTLDLCCYNSLCRLSITGWKSSSLPFSLHLFTSLDYLKLSDCPELESFPMGGFPSNLSTLAIGNCPKLIASREEWDLFQLNSLKYFNVSGHDFENVESFPEENLLPPGLREIYLDDCSKLRIMNYKGFLHLKSLSSIYIEDCPSLERLPEQSLPSTLSKLYISDCPLLKEKYKKVGGERWHTISHIHYVKIDDIWQKK